MSDPIRIFMVEDDARLREELKQMARSQAMLHWLGGAGSLREARALLASAKPDVVVIDLGLPDGDGIDLTAELARSQPPVLTLVSTVFGDEGRVIRAIEAGAGVTVRRHDPARLEGHDAHRHAHGEPARCALQRARARTKSTNACNGPGSSLRLVK